MDRCGLIENINLSGIEFNREGDTVTFVLVEMVPPYQSRRFVCHNIHSIILHRLTGDYFPYFVGEIVWRELIDSEKRLHLIKLDTRFLVRVGKTLR